MDTVSKKDRSIIMAKVKNKGSKIEMNFSKALWNAGFRYRKNVTKYFGKPDLVLKKYKTAIFIDSCFWHGCKKHCRMPSVNKKYWIKKIEGNIARDRKNRLILRKQGWKVLRVWEHEIEKDIGCTLKKVLAS